MVSIIILSYNTEVVLKRCLTSLLTVLKKGTFEVIVVDNASHDGSVKMLKKDFPQVTLIENKENVGFAAGCNRGAKEARGEYLLFLNSDIILSEDFLPGMITIYSEKSDVGAVGVQLVNEDGSLQRSYGSFYDLPQVVRLLFGGEKAELTAFTKKELTPVDWVTGGLLLMRKDFFEELDGFDETFFMYIEDVELCYRIHTKHKKVYVQPQITVTHRGQGSSNKTFAVVHIYKGLTYFYKKHKKPLQYTMLSILLRVKAALSYTVGFVTGNSYLKKTYSEAWQTL